MGVDPGHRCPPDVPRTALGFPSVQGDRLWSNHRHHGAVGLDAGDQLTARVARDHPVFGNTAHERYPQDRREVFGAGLTSDDRRRSLLGDAAVFEDDDAIREYECVHRVVGDDDSAVLELLQKIA